MYTLTSISAVDEFHAPPPSHTLLQWKTLEHPPIDALKNFQCYQVFLPCKIYTVTTWSTTDLRRRQTRKISFGLSQTSCKAITLLLYGAKFRNSFIFLSVWAKLFNVSQAMPDEVPLCCTARAIAHPCRIYTALTSDAHMQFTSVPSISSSYSDSIKCSSVFRLTGRASTSNYYTATRVRKNMVQLNLIL